MEDSINGVFRDSIFSSMHKHRCKICELPIVNPQVLSCLHVLCEQCLMYLLYAAQGNLHNNDYSIDCPVCKKIVTVGLSGTGTALKPYMISSSLFYCSSCVKDTNSVSRCQYCDKLFCLSCFREHSYVTCSHSSNGTKQSLACVKHNMECKYYCLKCDAMTCVFCLTNKNKHEGHEYVLIAEAETDSRSRIQQLLDNAKDNTNQCYETMSCLLEVLTNLRSKHESAKDELNSTFHSFMKLCDKYYSDATTNLNVIYLQQETKVKTLLHDIEVFSATIGNSCKSAKKILVEADSFTLCKLRAVLPVQFCELTELSASPENGLSNAKPDEKTFQIVLNDFHEKMQLNLDEFTASKDVKLSEIPALSTAGSNLPFWRKEDPLSTLKNPFKCTPLPINIKYQFGALGHFNTEFNSPSAFCLGRNDDIIIADKYNHRIQIFDKNGIFKFKFGVPGKRDGQLWQPSKVAVVQNDNRFIVADTGVERMRLQIFSENGIFSNKIPFFDVSIPAALDITIDGHIVIVDKFGPRTFVINEFGETIRSFECTNYVVEPSDVGVYGTEIFICDYKAHCVIVFSMDGIFKRYIGNKDVFSYPTGIHVTENDVFVCDSNHTRFHVARFERNGLFKASHVCMQMKVTYCYGLKENSDGDFFTLSNSHHCMFIIDRKSFEEQF